MKKSDDTTRTITFVPQVRNEENSELCVKVSIENDEIQDICVYEDNSLLLMVSDGDVLKKSLNIADLLIEAIAFIKLEGKS